MHSESGATVLYTAYILKILGLLVVGEKIFWSDEDC
jgi:hypothetical protein